MSDVLDLVIGAPLWQEVRSHLLGKERQSARRSQDEQLVFILAAHNETHAGTRLVAREAVFARSGDLAHQSAGGIGPTPEFVARVLTRCRTEGWSLVEAHSHPFDRSDGTTFSGIDWANDRAKMPQLARMLPHPFHHATMVVGHGSLDAHYYHRDTETIRPMSQLTIVGESDDSLRLLVRLPLTTSERSTPFIADKRYLRQLPLVGTETQEALSKVSIAVAGLGGLGSFVALELGHLGVGHLVLIDHDCVEETNLNRLLGASISDVGRPKVDVFAEALARISPKTEVAAVAAPIMDGHALFHAKSTDILVGCVDSHGARLTLNHIALRYVIPLIDAGTGVRRGADQSELRIGGQVQLVVPGVGCLECRGFIDPRRAAYDLASSEFQAYERAHGYGTEEPAPSVVFLNGVVASLQVAEVVRILGGTLKSQPPRSLVMYDAVHQRAFGASSTAKPGCVACGHDGVIGMADLAPLHTAATVSALLPPTTGTGDAGTDPDE